MNRPRPQRGLGRGLDALLPSSQPTPTAAAASSAFAAKNVFECALERIQPQSGQPRRHFEEQALQELALSIREHGLLEPIVVRKKGPDRFEIIAGERRWRACQRAGLREALVVVKDVDDKEAFELALIENVQREDLNAIEFAEALDRLLSDHGYTQEGLAARVGKDRSTIANALRLLKLPEAVRQGVIEGALSEGHARAILGAGDEANMRDLATKVQRGRLSVRQTEAEARRMKASKKGGAAPKKSTATRDLELRLSRRLGTPCEVRDNDGKGQLIVKYGSLDELDRILEILL